MYIAAHTLGTIYSGLCEEGEVEHIVVHIAVTPVHEVMKVHGLKQ